MLNCPQMDQDEDDDDDWQMVNVLYYFGNADVESYPNVVGNQNFLPLQRILADDDDADDGLVQIKVDEMLKKNH